MKANTILETIGGRGRSRGRRSCSNKSPTPGCHSSSRTPRTSKSTRARPRVKSWPTSQRGIDVPISGVGTGGHITACARVLKAAWPALKVFAVEPTASPVLSGGKPLPHPIQGIGAGFVPAIMEVNRLDGVIQVEADAPKDMARRAAREEGMLVGISSGAALAAIAKKLPDVAAAAVVLRFNYDTGERYLSTPDFLPGE